MDGDIRPSAQLLLHHSTPLREKGIQQNDPRQKNTCLLQQTQDYFRLKPCKIAPNRESASAPRKISTHLLHRNGKGGLLCCNGAFCRLLAVAELTDAPQPANRLLRTDRIDIGKVRRSEPRMNMFRQFRKLHLLLIIRPPSEQNDELCLRHRLHLIKCEIGRKMCGHAQIEEREQAAQFLHICPVHAAAVAEECNGSRFALRRLHKAVDECARSVEIARIVFPVEKAVRRYRHDGQSELVLHLRSDCLCIIADHAADTGICDEHRLRMVFLHSKAHTFTQTILPAKDYLTLSEPARQERNGREMHGCPCRRQPMKAAHIHPVCDVCARTRAVKNDKCPPYERQCTPNTGHAAAAVRPTHTDTLHLNPHSSPLTPRVPRTPSASARSAFRSYRLPVQVGHSIVPAPMSARMQSVSADGSPPHAQRVNAGCRR